MLLKHHTLNGSFMELLGRNTEGEQRGLSPPCVGKGFKPGTEVKHAGTHQPMGWLHHEAYGTVAIVRGRKFNHKNTTSDFGDVFKYTPMDISYLVTWAFNSRNHLAYPLDFSEMQQKVTLPSLETQANVRNSGFREALLQVSPDYLLSACYKLLSTLFPLSEILCLC